MYRLSVLCFMLVTLSCPMRCKPKQTATYFFAASIFSPFLIVRFSDNPFLCNRTIHLTMEQPVFVAQYTFLAIPETIEEERRIFRQGRPPVRVRDPFRGRRQILFPSRNPFRLRSPVRPLRLVHRQPERFQRKAHYWHGLVRERSFGRFHVLLEVRQRGRSPFVEQHTYLYFLQGFPQSLFPVG